VLITQAKRFLDAVEGQRGISKLAIRVASRLKHMTEQDTFSEYNMPISINDFSPHDQHIWEEELQDFVPDRVFDAHIHMFHPEHLKTEVPSALDAWGLADFRTLQQWAARLYPGRETHFLVLGTPVAGIVVTAHNRWCIDQVSRDPQSRVNRLVTPSCRVQDIERDVREQGFIGLKP